jgi:hypothetical protein
MSAAAFREAVEAKDLAALDRLLAPDVEFHRPATLRPVHGHDRVLELFGVLLGVFSGFRYVDELPAAYGAHGLVFHAHVGAEPVEGIDLLRFDDEGRVTSVLVMLRPLAGLLAIADAVSTRLVATGSSIR